MHGMVRTFAPLGDAMHEPDSAREWLIRMPLSQPRRIPTLLHSVNFFVDQGASLLPCGDDIKVVLTPASITLRHGKPLPKAPVFSPRHQDGSRETVFKDDQKLHVLGSHESGRC